jgi:hypothetical protein
MNDAKFVLELPETLLCAARDVAAARDVSVGQVIRDALKLEIRRAANPAGRSIRHDDRTLAVLRARYADAFAYAKNWGDLRRRLHDKGVMLREAGGGLALVADPGGARICKASDIGASLKSLAQRFRAPFPGHLSGSNVAYLPISDQDDGAVIEDWPDERAG